MELFGFLQLSDRQDFNPAPFCFSLRGYDGERTNVREQKDAHEFLNVAWDRLENLLKDTSQKYLLHNVLGGSTCSMGRCRSCGATSERTEPIFHLTVEVKNQHSLQAALRNFVSGEVVSDYRCEACG